MAQKFIRCFPNPFQRLDHQGVPAAAFPFDPSHAPDRRWVGAAVDRSPGPDGLPRTRPLETPGDLTFIPPRGRLKGRLLSVDRAPRKRVQFAFDLAEPATLPLSGHYLMGVRHGSLVPADEASARACGQAFVPPAAAWRASAAEALRVWEREHGEAPDLSLWPANLRAAAGLGEPEGEAPAAETAPVAEMPPAGEAAAAAAPGGAA